jgi:hypothetical protein
MGTPELNGNRTERQGIAFSLVNSVRAAVLCLAALTGCPDCGPGPDPDTDAGIPDASSADAGRADTGPGCRPDLFNPKNFMACANVDPGTPGTVAVSGVKAPYDRYNGYRVEVPDHATARPATFCVSPAVGANLPATDGGEIVPQAHGVEVFAVDTECPYVMDSEGRTRLNEVPLLKEVRPLFRNHRGRVLYFDDQAGTLTEMPYEITAEGTLGKVPHLSPFYLLNTDPVAKAAVTKKAGGGSVSFAGTKDEESETPHMMTYQVLDKDGNLLAESVGNGTLEIDLPAGTHELEMVATDPYGRKSSVTSQLIVDPAGADAGTPDTGLPAGPDAAAPGPDAAQPGQDAGQPGLDAAAPGTDAAQPGMDAGTPGPDAAQPGMDAAQPGLDAAQPGLDAAAPGPDAAQPGPDAGVNHPPVVTIFDANPNPTDSSTPVSFIVGASDIDGNDVTVTMGFVGDSLNCAFDANSKLIAAGSGDTVFVMTPELFNSGNVTVRATLDDGKGGITNKDQVIEIQ